MAESWKIPNASSALPWPEIWDLAMRLPLILYYGYQGSRSAIALAQEAAGRDWAFDGLTDVGSFLSRTTATLFMLVVVLCVAGRHRRLAAAAGFYPRLVAVLGTFILLATARLTPAPLPAWLQLAASGLILLGYVLSLWVVLRLGRSFSIMPEARRLITDGPYRLVRHPLYVTEEVAVIGLFLSFASWPAVPLFLLHAILQFERMRCEERVLRDAFPDYRSYAARTARLIPGLY